MDHRPSEGILPGDMILPMTVLRIVRPLEGIPDPSMSRGERRPARPDGSGVVPLLVRPAQARSYG